MASSKRRPWNPSAIPDSEGGAGSANSCCTRYKTNVWLALVGATLLIFRHASPCLASDPDFSIRFRPGHRYFEPNPVVFSRSSRQNTDLLLVRTPLGTPYAEVARFVRRELQARGEQRERILHFNTTLTHQPLRYGWSADGRRLGVRRKGVGTYSLFVDFGLLRTGLFGLNTKHIICNYAFDQNKRLVELACGNFQF